MCGEGCAKMEKIDLEIEDTVLFRLMLLAHEADVTFNKYIEIVLSDYLEEMESED